MGSRLNVSLEAFFSLVHCLKKETHLEDIFLPSDDSSNIYCIWIPHLKHVIQACDIHFDESKGYDPLEPHVPLSNTVTQLVDILHISESVEFDALPEQPEQPEQHLDEPITLPNSQGSPC